MAIQRVSGNILQDNLQRGANLSIQGNLAYFDVTNNRVGILTGTPRDEFNVIGVANASNVRITSATANGVFYAGNTLLALTNSGFTYDGINVDVTANLTAGNLISEGAVIGNVEISGNLVVNNLTVLDTLSGNIITATGNVTGANLVSNAGIYSQTANVSGNVDAGNVNVVSGVYSSTGFFTGNVDVLGNLNATIGVVYANSGIFYGNSVTGNNAAFAGIPGFTQLGSNVVMQFAGNVNSYSQLNFQNINNGTLASTDYVATADNGTDTTNYVSLGINSSTFNDPVNYPGYGPNDSYVHNNGGNLILNPESAGKTILLMVGGTDTANVVANVSSTGIEIYGLLDVSGNASVGNILTDGYYYANGAPVDFQQPAGANTEIQYNFNSDFGASANLTYDQATNIFQVGYGNGGNIQTDTLTVTGTITGDDINAQGNIQVNGDAIIDGNLTVNGDLVYNNVTSLNIEDPIISMGRGANNTPLTTNDGKDRGEQLWYFSSVEKSAFIGYDNSTGNLLAAVDVSIANEIVTVNQFGTWQIGNLYGQSALITGNVDAANISSTGNILATGNVIAGNVISSGAVIGNVEISGNLTVANLTVTDYFQGNIVNISNTISALGNITSGNLISNALISAGTTISATGNITGGNVVSNAAVSASTTIAAVGNITGGNLVSNASVSANTTMFANGNITGGNIISNGFVSVATTVSATGNITGGNIISNARIVGNTLDIYGDGLIAGNLTVQGNLTYINIDDLRVEDPIIQLGGGANGNALITNDGKDRGTLLTYYTTAPGNAFVGWDNPSGNMIVANDVSIANDIITVNSFGTLEAGNIYAESAVIVGNVSFGNISTSGQINATGNITGGNLVSNANISAASFIFATANVVGGNIVSNANISAATAIFANSNITGGNLVSNGFVSVATTVSATGNITGGNLVSNANISASNAIFATGNITSGNLVSNSAISAATTISATGNITGGNIVSNALITGSNVQVTSLTANRVVYVGTEDYLVDSANLTFDGANLILLGSANIDNIRIDGTAITSNANLSITATSGNILLTPGSTGVTQISSTTALTVPVGNTAQRPASPDQGAVRFNSTNLVLEVWDGTQWDVVGQDLAILTSQVINGDGSQVAFTLNEDTTSSGILVSINGVSQIPDVSYGVTGNVITFSEAPQVSDAVEVRFLTQIQTVTEITNTSGNAIVGVSATASQVNITGNLLPTANVLYSLGNNSLRWNDLYLAGNSIYLGNVIITNASGNSVSFFAADGTTPATISSGGGLDIGTGNLSVGNIFNNNANGVGNIGSSSTYFNTIFAKATSAQYADLAEQFECDQVHDTGTVMVFAGNNEITKSTQYADQRLAGIISTDPAYLMNATQANSVPIAMAGRVPCWVVGPVVKGDVLTTSSTAGHAEKLKNTDWLPGVIVGKALESAPAGSHKIMVVVGAW